MARLTSDVKQAESCRLTAYQDSLGFWTVGYGHRVPGPCVWSQDQADKQLVLDLSNAEGQAAVLPEWRFLDTDARQNAVAELVFNMGYSHWRMFAKTRHAICVQDWSGAHDGLLNSVWATEVHDERAHRLADYLLTGDFANGQVRH